MEFRNYFQEVFREPALRSAQFDILPIFLAPKQKGMRVYIIGNSAEVENGRDGEDFRNRWSYEVYLRQSHKFFSLQPTLHENWEEAEVHPNASEVSMHGQTWWGRD